MNSQEPEKESKIKLIFLLVVVALIGPMLIFLWNLYADWAKTLPPCDEIFWLERGLNFISLACVAISIWAFRESYLVIKFKQFPYPGSTVYKRSKIRKGMGAYFFGILFTIQGLFLSGIGIGISYIFSVLKASGVQECG